MLRLSHSRSKINKKDKEKKNPLPCFATRLAAAPKKPPLPAMRIRGRRRDAAGNPSLPIPPLYSDYQPPPPPSPLTDGRPESPDAHLDESSTAFRERIAPSSPRSSPPTASPPASCRFCEECEDADRGDKGRYAQLSEILKGRTGRSYRSSLPECKSDSESGSFDSHDEAKEKLELLCAVCSNEDLLESASNECKKVEICSCNGDNESKAIPDRSKRGNSITKSLGGRGKRSTSWGIEMRHQFGLQRATRTNNYHWTSDEVNNLVDGVSTLGVGRWTELKSTFFPTSIRTAQHLKDKWRNLLIACGLQVGRKKKVEAIRVTNNLRDRIIALHEKHISSRKRRASGD